MNPDTITQAYAARLRSAGLRVTQPRLAILEVLHGRIEPITIEELHESLSRSDCDLVTVYRCLDAFEAIGMVKRFYLRSGTTAFTTDQAGENLFVAWKDGCRSADVSPKVVKSLRDEIAAVEGLLAQRGYRDVRGLVQFFADPPAKS